MFLYGGDGESTTGVDHREWFARASQRFISAMEAMLEEGRLYKVDTRLRPSGEQGLLVTSWSAFERYHRDEAAGWERVALLRARVVYSNEDAPLARGRARRCWRAIAFDRPFDPAASSSPICAASARASRPSAGACRRARATCASIPAASWTSSSWSRSASSQHAADRRRPRHHDTAAALARLVALGWPESLLDDYAALRRATLRLRLLLDRPEDVVSPRDLPMLARSLGTPADALAADLDARLARVRALFDAVRDLTR